MAPGARAGAHAHPSCGMAWPAAGVGVSRRHAGTASWVACSSSSTKRSLEDEWVSVLIDRLWTGIDIATKPGLRYIFLNPENPK